MEKKITEYTIHSRDDFSGQLNANHAVMMYFSTPDCNVCKVLKPKVKALLASEFPEMRFFYVDCNEHPDVAAQESVFAVPTIIVYFEGRETVRNSRNFGIDELRHSLERPYQLLFGTELIKK